ncbi:GntR family transcriptional regulator [Pseudonocardia sp. TRM90224]|uniref:GntR family transcriptional regulator n=1 Tax=Pseudonocardia sp. TRM90224 TaxID=2812678 RepID=UPI001E575A1A|nr:GntR family transcriptional regulator [Pseudonocardia sp. TRM90224]
MEPLRRPSLRDQALAVIRQQLVAGEIRPGEIYSASAMATRLGTSNAPVREAMLTLVNQGVMEVVPNRGYRVTPVTEKDLDEVYQLRLLLEVPAVERLAARDNSAEAEMLREYARTCTKAAVDGDMTVFLEADRDFHLTMLGLLGNGRLVQMVEMLRDQTRLYGLRSLAEQGLLVSTAQEHFPLLEAVLDGDAPEAARMMTLHLSHVRGDWAGG